MHVIIQLYDICLGRKKIILKTQVSASDRPIQIVRHKSAAYAKIC